MSLATILRGPPTSSHPLIIFQSSAAQSSLPLLRCLISHAQTRVVLCTLLYPSQILTGRLRSDLVNIVDCTTSVPGYSDDANDCRERLLSAVTAGVSLPGCMHDSADKVRPLDSGNFSFVDRGHRLAGHAAVEFTFQSSRIYFPYATSQCHSHSAQ